MKRTLFALALLLLWIPANAGNGPAKGDLAMTQGVWIPVAAELSGAKFPDEVLKTMKLTIQDDKYIVNVGPQIDKGVVKLDPTAKPKAIDITGTDGPNQGRTFLAIYEMAGDTLRICYDLGGKERPTRFETAKGTQRFLVNYVKVKS